MLPKLLFFIFLLSCSWCASRSDDDTHAGPPQAPKVPDGTQDLNFEAPPGSIAIKVLNVRQTFSNYTSGALQINGIIANGKGGAAIRLNPMLFSIMTSQGLLVMPKIDSSGAGSLSSGEISHEVNGFSDPSEVNNTRYVGGGTLDPLVSLAGGFSFNFNLNFDLKGDAPKALVFNELGFQLASSGQGHVGRKFEAEIKVESCSSCSFKGKEYCTYFDIDHKNCGSCGRFAPDGGYCVKGETVCAKGYILQSLGGREYCGSKETDVHHCGVSDSDCSKVISGGNFLQCNQGRCMGSFTLSSDEVVKTNTCKTYCESRPDLQCENKFKWLEDSGWAFEGDGFRLNKERTFDCDESFLNVSSSTNSIFECACGKK